VTTVVDASVACKWFFQEAGSAAARRLLARSELLLAPDLVFVEVGNVAWKRKRAGAATQEQLREIAVVLPNAFTEVAASATLLPLALAIAVELDHPVYDCLYLALAERSECRLLTADARLLRVAAGSRWKRRVKALS